MDNERIDRLVNSVLYEGYLLYPYRPSLKNARRWNFGAVYPATSDLVRSGVERGATLARVLVVGSAATVVEGELRFLHLIERESRTSANGPSIWHEAEERRIRVRPHKVDAETCPADWQIFEFANRCWSEGGDVRRQWAIRGGIQVNLKCVDEGVFLLSVTIDNQTDSDSVRDSDGAMRQAFASAHLILHARGGEFVSRIDPPAAYADLCPSDPTDGLWPVLVGAPGQYDTLLCSPIILYDYTEVAPESPGDFFDATEIDEMLTLRILTLSDEEKRQVSALDARGRALLRRTDEMGEHELARLHGATRSLKPIQELHDGR
jgi:hypothetical protein